MQVRSVHRQGFTLVELLIVIVVIGILAAITIVAYNGVTQKAHSSALQGNLAQASQAIAVYDTENSAYPTNLTDAGIKADSNTTYAYAAGGSGYCVAATGWNQTYYVTSDNSQATTTPCTGYASDDFNRVNSSSLGSTELGNLAWAEPFSSASVWSINGNQLQVTNSDAGDAGVGMDMGTEDGTIQFTVGAPAQAGGGFGAVLRFDGNNFYEFMGDATYGYSFAKVTVSPYNWVEISPKGSVNSQVGDVVKVVLKGDTMTGYVNGAQQAQVTDSSISGTTFGVWANDSATIKFDNFSFAPN